MEIVQKTILVRWDLVIIPTGTAQGHRNEGEAMRQAAVMAKAIKVDRRRCDRLFFVSSHRVWIAVFARHSQARCVAQPTVELAAIISSKRLVLKKGAVRVTHGQIDGRR